MHKSLSQKKNGIGTLVQPRNGSETISLEKIRQLRLNGFQFRKQI